MQYLKRIKRAIMIEGILILSFVVVWVAGYLQESIYEREIPNRENQAIEMEVFAEKKFIKWVDFKITYEALCEAYKWDVETYKETQDDKSTIHLNWIELLAYVGTKHGGSFPSGSVSEIRKIAEKLKNKEATINELTKDMEYYPYYLEAYTAVLGGFVGEYEIQKATESGAVEWQKQYGLKAFSPIAKGFAYNDYDDFGTSRSYGYSRPHLGHDMMGQTGTPIYILYRT